MPLVLLGIRTSIKDNLGRSSAEMVYEQPLRLPGHFYGRSTSPSLPDQHTTLHNLLTPFRALDPVAPRILLTRSVFVSPNLSDATDVFVRLSTI